MSLARPACLLLASALLIPIVGPSSANAQRSVPPLAVERISVPMPGGNDTGPSELFRPGRPISEDGQRVVFVSEASLVPEDMDDVRDAYLLDREAGTIVLVGGAADGVVESGWSNGPSISSDGRFVVFQSESPILAANDSNGETDCPTTAASPSSRPRHPSYPTTPTARWTST